MGVKEHRRKKIHPKKYRKDKDKKSEAIKLEGNENYLSPLKFFCTHQTFKRHTYILLQ